MTIVQQETVQASKAAILHYLTDLIEQHDLSIDDVRLCAAYATVTVETQAEVEAWAKALGTEAIVRDRMPSAMHYETASPWRAVLGWTVRVNAIALTSVYTEVSHEVGAGLEDKVRARAAERASCAECERTSDNCSAHISACPVYQSKKTAAGVTA